MNAREDERLSSSRAMVLNSRFFVPVAASHKRIVLSLPAGNELRSIGSKGETRITRHLPAPPDKMGAGRVRGETADLSAARGVPQMNCAVDG